MTPLLFSPCPPVKFLFSPTLCRTWVSRESLKDDFNDKVDARVLCLGYLGHDFLVDGEGLVCRRCGVRVG